MEHQGFDPTGKYPAHQLYAQSLAGETVVKRMLVARPLDVQRLDKPEMLPGADAQRARHIWIVDRGQAGDRKSVVSGTSVSVRVDLGGSRILTKKTKK